MALDRDRSLLLGRAAAHKGFNLLGAHFEQLPPRIKTAIILYFEPIVSFRRRGLMMMAQAITGCSIGLAAISVR